jgi:flavin reductase (DIM6/NTAB) family NADH-FMN oxidoreductase RutF
MIPASPLQHSFDRRALRDALGRFSTGVAVITTCSESGKLEGLTANSFSALSMDPPLILWSLMNTARSIPSFRETGHFAVNVLAADHVDLSRHFARGQENKFEGVDYETGIAGCPILTDALATFECRAQDKLAIGDHVVFVGAVERLDYRDGDPLIFSAGEYCTRQKLRLA